jgi:hypothetical protein
MNELGKNIGISLLLGGIWGIILQTIFQASLFPAGLLTAVFYPLLFIGFLFISAFYFDLEIRFLRILITGAASGAGYYLLSGYFPLLSILFAAFIIAIGFTYRDNNKAGFITILLKGCICIPLGIFIADLFIQFSGILIKHQILSWFILAAVINVCFMITIIPISRLLENESEKTGDDIYRTDQIDDFRSESHDIIKDLNSIHTN